MYASCLIAESDNIQQRMSSFDTIASLAETSEDRFATTPVITVVPSYHQPNEEELHTSFEQAISDRVVAVHQQLRRVSGPLAHSRLHTEPLDHTASQPLSNHVVLSAPLQPEDTNPLPTPFTTLWQHSFVLVSLAIMLLLTGFDLMGLLILYVR